MNNSLDIRSYLEAVSYPADKDAILERVENSGASYEVLSAISPITDKQYEGPEDVLKEIQSREPSVTNDLEQGEEGGEVEE